MAVTIHSSPSDYQHSGNPLIFVFSSDQTAQANFSYKIEVSVNAVLKETHFILPEQGIYAHFDASDVAERNADTPTILGTDVYDAANYIASLSIEVIENYGTPPADQASSTSAIEVIKGKLTKRNFLNYTPSDYVYASGKLWLTLFPRNEKRYINLSYDNKFMYLTDSQTLRCYVQLYNSSGTPIASGTTTLVARDDVSIVNITNAILLATYSISQANIDASSYLELSWYDGINYSEALTLYFDDRCYSSSAKHLIFLSTIGSLEPYTFIKRTVEGAKIKSQGIEKQFGYLDSSGTYNFQLGGNVDFVKEIDNTLEVQTDYINEDEYSWLVKELLTSPFVYLLEDSNLIPVKVTDSSYSLKTSENEMVFNLKVKLERERDTSTVV